MRCKVQIPWPPLGPDLVGDSCIEGSKCAIDTYASIYLLVMYTFYWGIYVNINKINMVQGSSPLAPLGPNLVSGYTEAKYICKY